MGRIMRRFERVGLDSVRCMSPPPITRWTVANDGLVAQSQHRRLDM